MFISLLAILLTRVMKNTWLAGTLISAGLFVLIILADDFSEIAGGRSTFFFSIPILHLCDHHWPFLDLWVCGLDFPHPVSRVWVGSPP